MAFEFKKATKTRSRLRMAIDGPSGSGKTFTSIKIATYLAQLLCKNKQVAVGDSERGSAAKYSDIFDFYHAEFINHSPGDYVECIKAAEKAGFEILVLDSLSHAWMGKDGALAQVDKVAARAQTKNNFTAWREVTPMHNAMIDAILQSPMHIIVTMRTKTEFVQEKDDKGKTVVRKIGMAPVQRDGMEYEFDVVGDMDLDNTMVIGKTRCHRLAREVFKLPGEEVARILADWLGDESIPEKGPTKAEELVKEKMSWATDAEISALFDKLDATPAKREATLEKYETKELLMKALQLRVEATEKEKTQNAVRAAEKAKADKEKTEDKKETNAPS